MPISKRYDELLEAHRILDGAKEMMKTEVMQFYTWLNVLVDLFNSVNKKLASHDLVLPMGMEKALTEMVQTQRYVPDAYHAFDGFLNVCHKDITQSGLDVGFDTLFNEWHKCDAMLKKLQQFNEWHMDITSCEEAMRVELMQKNIS